MVFAYLTLFIFSITLMPLQLSAGMLDDGTEPYEKCALCHGLYGNSTRDKFPKLAGQSTDYLEAQVRNFLSGARNNDGGQMAAIVTELKEKDIAVVADWFSSQPDPTPASEGDTSGEQFFRNAGCGNCHSSDSKNAMPKLHAQHAAYLNKQMRELRDGDRIGDLEGLMQKQLATLSDVQITSVAVYLAAQAR